RWTLVHGWREVPAAPRRVPHFHINLLPDARRVSTTRALMSAYLSYLYRSGEKRVYGQIVTFESRRGEKMFERYGFKVLNRAEIDLGDFLNDRGMLRRLSGGGSLVSFCFPSERCRRNEQIPECRRAGAGNLGCCAAGGDLKRRR